MMTHQIIVFDQHFGGATALVPVKFSDGMSISKCLAGLSRMVCTNFVNELHRLELHRTHTFTVLGHLFHGAKKFRSAHCKQSELCSETNGDRHGGGRF